MNVNRLPMRFVTHATDTEQVKTTFNAFEAKCALVVACHAIGKHAVGRMK